MSSLRLILILACGFHASAEPLHTVPAVCIAPVSIGSILAVGKLGGNARDCRTLASTFGTSISVPYFVESGGQYCYVPYYATVSQVQEILRSKNHGTYQQCSQAESASVGKITQSAVAKGLISSSGENKLPYAHPFLSQRTQSEDTAYHRLTVSMKP